MPGLVYGHSGGLTQAYFVEPGRAAGAVPCIGDGSNHWALVHVDDLAELYVLALNAPAGSVYAGVGGENLPSRTSPGPSATPPDVRARSNR